MTSRPFAQSVDRYTYLCYENDTISNSLVRYGYWENNLVKHAEQYLRYDSVILDIGANIGTWSIPLAIKQRTVHAFEPYDTSYYALCGNIFLNRKEEIIIPHHAALTDDANKTTMLYLPEQVNMGGCKLLETGIDTATAAPNAYALMTVDSLKLGKIDFIKLDVEGQELNVLKGAEDTIMKCKPVIFFECWAVDSHHWENIPNTHDELFRYVESLGYKVNKVDIDGNDNYEAIPL